MMTVGAPSPAHVRKRARPPISIVFAKSPSAAEASGVACCAETWEAGSVTTVLASRRKERIERTTCSMSHSIEGIAQEQVFSESVHTLAPDAQKSIGTWF